MKLGILGYVIFAVFCFCIAIYRHFPGDTGSNYIQHEILKLNSNLKIDMEGIKPAFPPGIKASTLFINYAGIPLIFLEKFKLGFDLFSVFSDAEKYLFRAIAKDGTLSGSLTLPGKKEGQIFLESEFKALLFDRLDLGKYLYDLQLSGILSGEIVAKLDKQKLKTSQGNIHIAKALFEQGSLNFGGDEISFSSVDVMFSTDAYTLTIENCRMRGKQLDLESSGEIKIAQLFENSRLNLDASIELHPRFFMEAGNLIPAEMAKGNSDGTTLYLTIGGTLQNPKIKMLQEKK